MVGKFTERQSERKLPAYFNGLGKAHRQRQHPKVYLQHMCKHVQAWRHACREQGETLGSPAKPRVSAVKMRSANKTSWGRGLISQFYRLRHRYREWDGKGGWGQRDAKQLVLWTKKKDTFSLHESSHEGKVYPGLCNTFVQLSSFLVLAGDKLAFLISFLFPSKLCKEKQSLTAFEEKTQVHPWCFPFKLHLLPLSDLRTNKKTRLGGSVG